MRAAAPVAVIRTEAAEPIPELSLLPAISVEQLLAGADHRDRPAIPAVAPEPAELRGYWSMTSGSTGEPKLVHTGERPLAHFLDWLLNRSVGLASAMVDGTRRPVAGIASDPLDQVGEIDEFVRLAAQFIRHHWRLG